MTSFNPLSIFIDARRVTLPIHEIVKQLNEPQPAMFSGYASALGLLAQEQLEGRLHINADWIIFEPVDANHVPVPAGQFSDRTLITNLANRVMPIIRYELGDRVSPSGEPCPCDITLPVVTVEGRTDEILRLRSASAKELRATEPVPPC
jgi:phenylacetate-coenzyme A ligase PaaK-like adenylate-forming protein